jgi:photosystem II stability/assembly factor-like uncharacterized protein
MIAAEQGHVLYYDGATSWQYLGGSFEDLWADSLNNIFIVSEMGRVHHLDTAVGITEMTTPTAENLYGVWGFSSDDVYAVGNGGIILNYDGLEWIAVTSPTTLNLSAVWGSGPDNIYAVGQSGTIIHYDSTNWKIEAAGQFSMDFSDITGFAPDNIYSAGKNGLLHFDGTQWTSIDTENNSDFTKLWAIDKSNIYIVDSEGNVFRYTE